MTDRPVPQPAEPLMEPALSTPAGTDRSEQPARPVRADKAKKTHPASGARVLTTGISVAAGIGLVGAMGFAARAQESQPPPAVQTIVRQVVVPQPQGETVIYVQQGAQPAAELATVQIPVNPQPVEQVVAQQAATQSQGS